MPTRKVAILHDWLTGYRGGERVLEAICELYPEAPIYTLIHKKGSTSPFLESRQIITSWLDKIPGIHENYRYFLPLMPLAVNSLKIPAGVELVISSSHCVIKGVKKPEGSKHISYIHSPMRYMYDQFDNYFGQSHPIVKIAAHSLKPFLRTWDSISNANVDVLVANSNFVRSRIDHFYGKKAQVIFPFVDLKDFVETQKSLPPKGDHFIMVTAFAPNKRVDMAIRTFNKNGLPLRIIGTGSREESVFLKGLAKNNIQFLGNISRKEVIKELSTARALIFPGIEDFGIVPLESLAAGTPVIAYGAGGVLDTLDDKTAVFFHEKNEDSLQAGIEKFEQLQFLIDDLFQRAQYFSKELFQNSLKELVINV